MTPRWPFLAVLLLLVAGTLTPRAHALPLPPPADRSEWAWEAVPVHHDLDPGQATAHAPHVPAGTPSHTGPVVLVPGRAVLVWVEAFDTVRIRSLSPAGRARPTFTRLVPGEGRAFARIEEPGLPRGEGTWWLQGVVGRGEPWLVESDRRLVLVVERPVPRLGARIWEHVHEATLAWIEGKGSLPHLPAVPGAERYLRRRVADRELAEEARRLPGYDGDVQQALVAWRQHRASLELDALRTLEDRKAVGPEGDTVEVPQLVDPDQVPEDAAELGMVRVSAPWTFRVRGSSVLRLHVRALLPAEGRPPSRPIDVVVTTPGDAGGDVVIARLATTATPLRVRDPMRPDDPIPTWVDAVATTGERVSKDHVLAVPLRPGRHVYRLESRGGPVALRAELGRVVGRVHERRAPQWRERVRERAIARLEEVATPAASMVRALLAEPWQPRPAWPEAGGSAAPRVRALLELEALGRNDASAAEQATEAARIAHGLPRRSRPDALDIELRMQAFERLQAAGRSHAAVELLRGVAHRLNGDELPAWVAAVDDPGPLWPLEGALDVVARRAPLTSRLRGAYVRLWTWTRWSRLYPSTDVPAWEWIEPPGPDEPPSLGRGTPGRVSALPIGSAVELDAPPHPFEAGRTPLLRILARAPRAVDGVLALEVDGRRWSAPMHGRAEVLELAVPVGTHRVRLGAPDGVEAFSSLHPARDPTSPAGPGPVLTTMWPARWEDRPVRFELGALPRATLAEVDVRVVGVPARGEPAPVELWVCFDDGSRRRARITPGPAPRELLALTGPAASSERARVVVPVPARATELWVEPIGGATLAVAAKLRQWDRPATASQQGTRASPSAGPAGAAPSEGPAPTGAPAEPLLHSYERLAESTRRVAAEPTSASLRLEHAHRLLDVGDVRRAKQALTRVIEQESLVPTHPLLPAVRILAARIDAFVDDAFVELGPAATGGPLLLQPAVAALEPSDPTRAEVLAAAAAAHEGRPREAFERHTRVHAQTGALAPGYAAAQAYAQALAGASPGALDAELAPLSYGLVTEVRRRVDTPKLRRLHHHVMEATQWEPLQLAERSAGTVEHGVEIGRLELTDAARLQWALLAPPWSLGDARLLRPGTRMVMALELPEPREIDIEAFCDDPEPLRPAEAPAALEIHMGDPKGATTTRRSLATTARAIVRERLALPQGTTRLELELPAGPEERRCAVRWVVADPLAPLPTPERPMRWLLAKRSSPVEAIVLGPTTLQLEVSPAQGASPVTATVQISGPSGEDLRTITVSSGEPSSILVPWSGARRVVVTTASAEILVRLALRRRSGVEPSPTPAAEEDERPLSRSAKNLPLGPAFERTRILWPAGSVARLHERIGEPTVGRQSRLGSFATALAYSRTDIPETDAPRPRDQLRGSVLWRRELRPNQLWIKLAGHTQGRSGAGAAAGGDATLYAQRGPRRLRGVASVGAWSERYAGAAVWSLRGSLVVDRPLELTPTVVLVPFVRGVVVYQSLGEAGFDPAAEPSHPTVYSPYLEDHPLAVTPGARVRWFPFQDLQVVGELATTPNSDFASVDHVDADLGVHGIVLLRVPLLVRYGGTYGSSVRVADEHRDRTFVRHGPRLLAGLTWVIRDLGRLSLDVHDSIYLARPLPTRNGLDVIVSFELTLGRGIRDTAPMELLFRPQYRNQWWRPTPPGRAP